MVQLYCQKKLMKVVKLPKNGKCEILTNRDRIIISNSFPIPKNQIAVLKSKLPICPIEKMVEYEEPDID